MSLAQDFGVFWAQYPRKVGKLAAEKAYAKAIKRGVAQQRILDGVERYKANKPEYADWCHPQTFLNQGRYDDEYERRNGNERRQDERREPPITADERRRAVAVRQAWGFCRHDPPCETGQQCVGRIVKQWRERERDGLDA